jgi:hypothetical protein
MTMEPEKYLPFNRTDLIARCEALETAIRWALGEVGEFPDEPEPRGKYRRKYYWRTELRKRAGLSADTPPHLRGPIIQAHADTNGVPVHPTAQHASECPLLYGGECDCNPTPLETPAKPMGKIVPRCTGEHVMRKEEDGIFCAVCGIADYQLTETKGEQDGN